MLACLVFALRVCTAGPLGDVDLLEPGAAEPRASGRFFCRTSPLPESLTKGRMEVRCEIRPTDPIRAYGNTVEAFQKPVVAPGHVFTDEENGEVALKHGAESVYASLYRRARHGRPATPWRSLIPFPT